jgi:hypothetical protein
MMPVHIVDYRKRRLQNFTVETEWLRAKRAERWGRRRRPWGGWVGGVGGDSVGGVGWGNKHFEKFTFQNLLYISMHHNPLGISKIMFSSDGRGGSGSWPPASRAAVCKLSSRPTAGIIAYLAPWSASLPARPPGSWPPASHWVGNRKTMFFTGVPKQLQNKQNLIHF